MSATVTRGWPELDAIASLALIPPADETDLERRLEMQLIGPSEPDADRQAALPLSITALAVHTAGDAGTRAYVAMEDGALDRILADLQQSIIREVEQAR